MYGDAYAVVYAWNKRQWPSDEPRAAYLSAFALAGAMLGNLLVAVLLFVIASGPPFREGEVPILVKAATASVCVTVVLANNWFVSAGKHVHAIESFTARPPAAQRRTHRATWTYVLASYLSPMGFAILYHRLLG